MMMIGSQIRWGMAGGSHNLSEKGGESHYNLWGGGGGGGGESHYNLEEGGVPIITWGVGGGGGPL